MPTLRHLLESFGRHNSWMMWFFGMPIDPRRSTSAASHDRGAVSADRRVTRAPSRSRAGRRRSRPSAVPG